MDPVGDGRADGHRGGHRHHGQHLQLDERPAPRNRRDAGPGRQPRHRHAHHPDGVDPAVADGRGDGLAAGPRQHLGLLAADRRLDGRGRGPVAVPVDRVDLGSRTGRAGLGRRLPARDGRLSHRRGQVVDHHAMTIALR